MRRLLTKAQFFDTKRTYNTDIEIFKNPSSREIRECKNDGSDCVRGVIQDDGTEYCWRGDALHFMVEDVVDDNCFHFSFEEDYGWFCDMISKYSMEEFCNMIIKYQSKLSKYGNVDLTWELAGSTDAELQNKSFQGIEEIKKYVSQPKIASRLKKVAQLPTLRNDFDSLEYDYIDIGRQTVNVSDIAGLSDTRVDEYNDDWTPKDPEDARWLYQKNLVDNGKNMEPIPLIKAPNGKYYPSGDGNHRISVAKVCGLQTVEANVSVMVPKDAGIDQAWEEHSKDRQQLLKDMEKEYKSMRKNFDNVRNEAYETGDSTKYEKYMRELDSYNDQMAELERELLQEEKEFKNNLVQEYINK